MACKDCNHDDRVITKKKAFWREQDFFSERIPNHDYIQFFLFKDQDLSGVTIPLLYPPYQILIDYSRRHVITPITLSLDRIFYSSSGFQRPPIVQSPHKNPARPTKPDPNPALIYHQQIYLQYLKFSHWHATYSSLSKNIIFSS